MRNAAGASVILVRLCFSSPCITPVSLALYVCFKCLVPIEFKNDPSYVKHTIASSWRKSGQQTAFNYTFGRPTLNVDLV